MKNLEGYPIKVAARRTGLSTHVIRVWERRYGAVEPTRTDTNRRLYTEEDIERLRLLQRATASGHSIGQIAKLPGEELEGLVKRDQSSQARGTRLTPEPGISPETLRNACLDAVRRMDAEDLDNHLARGEVSLSVPELLDSVVVPFMDDIGCEWREGGLRIANEHMASAAIRTFLGSIRRSYVAEPGAPQIVVTTPPGQQHEIGALLAAVMAASEGWRVTYLGPNLPLEEAAGAAQVLGARALALSILYPADDPKLGQELQKFGRLLPEGTTLIVGGRAANGYRAVFDRIGAEHIDSLREMRDKLAEIRSTGVGALTSVSGGGDMAVN